MAAVPCGSLPSEAEQVACIATALQQLQVALEPRPQLEFSAWPGNNTCVSCRFAFSLLLCAVEIALLYGLYVVTRSLFQSVAGKLPRSFLVPEERNLRLSSTPTRLVVLAVGVAATLGITYWSVLFFTYWNFISYIMPLAAVLIIPPNLLFWNSVT